MLDEQTGRYFDVDQLVLALTMIEKLPVKGTCATIATDHPEHPEVIEITPPGWLDPAFFVWTREGDCKIVVDGWRQGGGMLFESMEEAIEAVRAALIKARPRPGQVGRKANGYLTASRKANRFR